METDREYLDDVRRRARARTGSAASRREPLPSMVATAAALDRLAASDFDFRGRPRKDIAAAAGLEPRALYNAAQHAHEDGRHIAAALVRLRESGPRVDLEDPAAVAEVDLTAVAAGANMTEERLLLATAILDRLDPDRIAREIAHLRRTRRQQDEEGKAYRARVQARLSRPRSRAIGRGWRPADGPKPKSVRGCDGRWYAPHVVLYDERMGRFELGFWDKREGRWSGAYVGFAPPNPTHWAPIPTPPGGWPFMAEED